MKLMDKYAIVPPTDKHIQSLALNMGKADVDEIWAAGRILPLEALEQSVSASPEPYAGLYKEQVLCMFGVAELSILDNKGIPWMLSTDELKDHARPFLRGSKIYIDLMKVKYPFMFNYVDVRNRAAIRWLKWLQFRLLSAEPHGPDQMLFHRFEMGVKDV